MEKTQKIALVTGAHSGIGRATAIRLAADGHAVVCVDVQGTDDTVAQIEAAGGTAFGLTLDVSKAADWDAAMAVITEKFGGVDLMAAVAGVVNRLSPDTVVDLTEEAWDHVLGINAKGIWLGMRAVIPSMLERGGGRIVNIASLAAHKGLQGLASYTASKGAVEALTRQASVEYGRQGILINAIAPGTIETPINAALLATPEGAAASLATTTIGRWGQPAELAAAVSFLLNEGSFVNGQVLLVDGGWDVAGGVTYDSTTM